MGISFSRLSGLQPGPLPGIPLMAKPVPESSHPSDEDLGPVSAQLAAELDRRLADHQANPAAARPWHAVFADLRQRFK